MHSMSAIVLALFAVLAQSDDQNLPDLPGEWVNGGPYTRAGLKDKVILFYFVDRTCPDEKKPWSKLSLLAKEKSDQPALVVGVLTGCSKSETESYVKANGITIPMYVDADRWFEKTATAKRVLNGEINTAYPRQCFVVDGKGLMCKAQPGEPARALERSLTSGAWKVDPAGVPEVLKPAWHALEFGQYSAAAPKIAEALRSKDPEVKAAAEALAKAIRDEIATRLGDAETKAEAGGPWVAYKAYEGVAEDFKGFDEVRPATDEMKKLGKDKAVAQELKARTQLAAIVRDYLNAAAKAKQDRGRQMLEQLIKKFPDTEAAAAAKEMK